MLTLHKFTSQCHILYSRVRYNMFELTPIVLFAQHIITSNVLMHTSRFYFLTVRSACAELNNINGMAVYTYTIQNIVYYV